MAVSAVYITARDEHAASELGRALVREQLAACVNILPGMTSIYHWDGQLEESSEAVLIVKTRTELVESVITRVRELHDYDCPCIVSWPLTQGNPAYLDWIKNETISA